MNKLFPTTLLAIALTTSAAASFAGRGDCFGDGGPSRGMQTPMLERILTLTDEQKSAIADINATYATDGNPRAWLGDQMRDLDPQAVDYQQQVDQLAEQAAENARERVLQRADVHAQIQAVLTEEQRLQLKDFKASNRVGNGGGWRR